MGAKTNKTERQNSNRKIVGAIRKHLTETVTLEGVKYAPARLAKMFQTGIDVADATDGASKAWHLAVATERESTQELSGVQLSLRNHVSATFGESSAAFADFGFVPKMVRTVDTKTKAGAVVKRAATRVARNTVGSRQKLKITGATSSAVSTQTAAPTPAAPEAPPASPPSPAPAPPATTSPANVAPDAAAKVTGSV